MAKRKAKRTTKRVAKKKVPRKAGVKNAEARLRQALAKQTKGVLLDLVVNLAMHNRTILRELEERFVIKRLKGASLPKKNVLDWCKSMEKEDRVGFICDQELKTLREKYTT